MSARQKTSLNVVIVVMPNFNLAATAGFIDPFRAANYLDGAAHFRWSLVSSTGGPVLASNGITIETRPLTSIVGGVPDIAIVSSSWAPESHVSPILKSTLKRWARAGTTLGALDTGAFILAALGLLAGRRATVHYEHIDALRELFPDITVSEQLMVLDGDRITCCGGEAAVDFGLHIIRGSRGDALANEAARYLFHERLRPATTAQNPAPVEPLGSTVPAAVRKAIKVMEENLESALSIPQICRAIGLSQRQLDRLFERFVRRTPAIYYRDIRLDRARGLVTQTDMPLSEVAIACGFSNQVHFSRAYRERYDIQPRADRIQGRIPFEFRAWPMYHPQKAVRPKRSRRRMAKKDKKMSN